MTKYCLVMPSAERITTCESYRQFILMLGLNLASKKTAFVENVIQ